MGENRMDHKKKLKPVLLINSPLLLPSFFRREEKRGKE